MADPTLVLYSVNEWPGDGVQNTFEISFSGGYISKDHVKSSLMFQGGNGVEWPFTWVNDFTILTTTPPPLGFTLRVYRETPRNTPLADFSDGAIVTEISLDTNAKQAVFLAAEAQDQEILNLRTSITTPHGAHLTAPGFILLGEDGTPVTTPYLDTIIKSGVEVTDYGTWGGEFETDYGAWG
jgi:hypothetical protein